MKKILALITIFVMVLSLSVVSVSAAGGYATVNDNLELKAVVTAVKNGKAQITFTLSTAATDFSAGAGLYDKDWEEYADGTIKGFISAGVTYKALAPVFTESTGSLVLADVTYPYDIKADTSIAAKATLNLTSDYAAYTADQLNAMDIVEVTLVTADIKEYACANAVATLAKWTSYRTDGNGDFSVAVTVPEAAGEEPAEEFVVDVEAGYTKDTIAIFAKNVTDEAFAAGTYGVIFGGNKYAAGVNPDTDCEAGKTFVVKFVGGADKLASGSYKYQAYYNNGVDVTTEKVLNIQ